MNSMFLAIGLPGGSEWFWIFLAVMVLFGPKKLPDLARGLGRGVGEFRRAKEEFERELANATTETPAKQTPQITPAGSTIPASVPDKNTSAAA